MDCLAFEGDLVPFHFGTLPEAERARLEEHLGTCPRCLGVYFQTKRAVEQKETPRPSTALRARLRSDVAVEFGRPQRVRRLWTAVAASAAAAVLVGVLVHQRAPAPLPTVASQDGNVVEQPIDSARDVNTHLAFF